MSFSRSTTGSAISSSGLVDTIDLVSDAELLDGVRVAFEHFRLIIEPSAAAGLAAIANHRGELAGQHVATVFCGANVTSEQAQEWLMPAR